MLRISLACLQAQNLDEPTIAAKGGAMKSTRFSCGTGPVEVAVLVILVLFMLCAKATGAGPVPLRPSAQAPVTKPPIQEISPGLFLIGDVRLDKNKKTVSFPAYVNMSTGIVEYAVVGSHGKLHESVLATKAEPYHIHLAMLLLGVTNKTAKVQSGQSLAGQPIHIFASWKIGNDERNVRLENLICKEQPGRMMSRGTWLYNGSRVIDGNFLAQRDESIVAIIEDSDALINNPRKGREDDQIWSVNEKEVPPKLAPVQITLELSTGQN